MSQDGLKSQAVHGVAWTMAEKYSGQIVQFVISVVLARILTPDEYGLIGMLAIFMALSNIFIDGGFSSALIQCKDRSNKDISTVFYLNVAIAVVIYCCLCWGAPLIAEFYGKPELILLVKVYCLSLIINSLSSTSYTKVTIELNFKVTTKISLVSGILSGLVGIYMAYKGYGVWALVGQGLTGSVLGGIMIFIFVRWYPNGGFSFSSFRKLFTFSSKLFIANLISVVYDQFFGVLIGRKFNAASLAYYNRANSLNTLLNNNITNVLGRVSYPLLSKIQDDDERLKSIYTKYIQISAFLTFPLIMLLCGAAKPIILTLFTDKWASSIVLLQVLSFSFLWDGVIVSNLNLIKVKGRSDLVLKLEVVKKAIAFFICGIAILLHSVLAICVARAVYSIIALYLNTYYTKQLISYGFWEQIRGYWMYLLGSLIILITALLISAGITDSLLALGFCVTVCPALYIGFCALFRLYAYREVKQILLS